MTNQTQQPQQSAITVLRKDLTQMRPQFQMALPPHISVEKFERVALTALQMNPGLQNAERGSLFASFTRAAQMGLLPDSREGAVVMFSDKAQFMPMIGGILKLARNSGDLASLDAQIVHQNDKFTYRPGLDLVPVHEPDWFEKMGPRGEAIGVYAVAKMKDGAAYVEVMSKAQVEKVRQVSRAKGNGPWVAWWDEMARKTVIRRLAKRLPMSTDLEEVLHEDDSIFNADPSTGEIKQPAPAATRAPGRASRLDGVRQQAQPTNMGPVEEVGQVIDGELTTNPEDNPQP